MPVLVVIVLRRYLCQCCKATMTVGPLGSCLLDGSASSLFVEHEGRRFPLHPCNPKFNSGRRRTLCAAPPLPSAAPAARVPFDPGAVVQPLLPLSYPAVSEEGCCDDDLSDLF